MLMAAARRRKLGVGVAGVLNLNLLSFGTLDLHGDVWGIGRERGQANIFLVLLQGKSEVTSEGKESKKSTRFKLRVLTAGACFSAVKGRSPSSSHTGTTDGHCCQVFAHRRSYL